MHPTETTTTELFAVAPTWTAGPLPDDPDILDALPHIADHLVTHGRLTTRTAMTLGPGLSYRDTRTALDLLAQWRALEPGDPHRSLVHRDHLPALLNALGGLR